jgi:opacity protein-like surface antigen
MHKKRRTKMKIRMIIFVLFAILFVTESDAQYRERSSAGSIGIGPQLGYFKSGDADDGSIWFGGFIRAKLSEGFGLDLSVNYRSEEYAGGRVEVSQWPVLASALIYPFPVIYGIAGAGLYFTSFTFDVTDQVDAPDETASRLGWHLGAGVELPLSEMVKLTGDIKYVFLDYDLEDFGDVSANELNANFYIINIGLAFGLR